MHRKRTAALLLAPLLAFVPLTPALAAASTLVRLGTDTEGTIKQVGAAAVNDERLVNGCHRQQQ